MEAGRIKVVWSDTGHWVARCSHESGVIELNRTEFPRLSPMMRDYVFVHEYVHLLCDEFDENRCNLITDEVFIRRGRSGADRRRRRDFVNRSNSDGPETDHLEPFLIVSAAVSAAAGIASTLVNVFRDPPKTGYYAMKKSERMKLVREFVDKAFQASLNTGDRSARDIFWEYMSQCGTGDANYTKWLVRNSFITRYIKEGEAKYGVGFGEVKGVDYTRYSTIKIAMALALVGAAILIIKAARK
ncbi:MAG: hypothetical protein MJZ90_06155 [Bacteroidales bacterium]|nr:hypothetical protein [Bacteroidales bacterium]